MEKILYKLESFEGPLDLLLTLIQKNKGSIWDIPIVEITEQYLDAIEGIEGSGLDDTSEFLVMAANLLWIKSRMLLPKNNDDDEEEEDPREDLARRLAEYKAYKDASEELRKTEGATKDMVFRGEEHISFPVPEYSRHHEVDELIDAFNSILARRERNAKPEKRAFSGIVGREKVSVYDMSLKIKSRFKRGRKVDFKTLFEADDSKPVMIATFLALLEMIKDNVVSVEYDYAREDFVLTDTGKEVGASASDNDDTE
ncbi:MAG: segregation/condensation protein A [Firmicutes bacterium]|nr:segregation/condensation protein A [Bacillota bacterium]